MAAGVDPFAPLLAGDRVVDGARVGGDAADQDQVGLLDPFARRVGVELGLQGARGGGVLREDQRAAGAAVEAVDWVHGGDAQVIAHQIDQGRIVAIPAPMDQHACRFGDDQGIEALPEHLVHGHSAQRPYIRISWLRSRKPFGTRSRTPPVQPGTSKTRPQVSHWKWWWCSRSAIS